MEERVQDGHVVYLHAARCAGYSVYGWPHVGDASEATERKAEARTTGIRGGRPDCFKSTLPEELASAGSARSSASLLLPLAMVCGGEGPGVAVEEEGVGIEFGGSDVCICIPYHLQ